MGENKKLRKRRKGIERTREAHQMKVNQELARSDPDWETVRHWQREIANWNRQIEEIDRKLRKR